MSPLIDIAGHLSYILIAAGLVLIGKKDKNGWILRFVGELGWTAIGFKLGMSSLWIWGLLFLVIDAANYFRWKRKETWYV